jgi:uncharacterized protein (DUF433 family)
VETAMKKTPLIKRKKRRNRRIAGLFKKGIAVETLAIKFNLTKGQIFNVLHKEGIRIKNKKEKIPRDDLPRFFELRQSEKTFQALGNLYNVSREAMRLALQKHKETIIGRAA